MNHSLIAPRRAGSRPSAIGYQRSAMRSSAQPPPLPREALEERILFLEAENAILRQMDVSHLNKNTRITSHLQRVDVSHLNKNLERNPDLVTDTTLAMIALGIKQSDAQRRVQAAPFMPGETVESLLKLCLKTNQK